MTAIIKAIQTGTIEALQPVVLHNAGMTARVVLIVFFIFHRNSLCWEFLYTCVLGVHLSPQINDGHVAISWEFIFFDNFD